MTPETHCAVASARAPRPWIWLPAALALTTGMIDVTGWVQLSGFYTANITGDFTQSASYILPGQRPHLLQMLAVPVFLLGLVCTYFTVRRMGGSTPTVVRVLLVVQVSLLAAAAAAAGAFGPLIADGGLQKLTLGLVAVLTISLSNTAMKMLDPRAPTTWALTANIVRAGVALLDVATRTGDAQARAKDWALWNAIWPTVLAFLAGGLGAIASLRTLGARAWLVPLTVSLVYAVLPWRQELTAPGARH